VSPPVRLLSPQGAIVSGPMPVAAPVASLAGQPIAVLDNGKPNARLLLTTIAERLAARTDARVSLVMGKATAAEPAEPDILQQLAAARVVITGSAD
jgi:hypothetical protein